MPQDPIPPQNPQGENSKPTPSVPPPTGAGAVDLSKILLPKKDPSVDSAQRVNAGALLQSEQTAVLTPTAQPIAPAPQPKPAPQKDESVVRSVETYQGDIEKLVQNKNVSVVSIAAAEAGRREAGSIGAAAAQEDGGSPVARVALIIGGVLLLLCTIGLVFFILRPVPSVEIPPAVASPFITVDETKVFTVPAGDLGHAAVINALDAQRQAISLSLGLIARLYLAEASVSSSTALVPLTAQRVLSLLSPSMPDTLSRAVDPNQYLLAVHAYAGNQALLILKTTAYEQAFSGMLAWEGTMKQDLSPLFSYTPPAKIITSPVATSTATTTPPVLAQSGFVDKIVENHDARVVLDANGNIVLLWTFADRNTIVITTNEATLREIISRLNTASVVPTP